MRPARRWWWGVLLGALALPTPGWCQAEPLVLDRPPLVTAKTEKAIDKGLRWLARAQTRDGSFSDEGGVMGSYPCAMTALAGMAFLSHGDTPTRGRYAETVRRSVRFLVDPRQAGRNGLITSESERGRSMYGHGFSLMFLAQVLGEDGDPELERRIRAVLHAGVRLTAQSQSEQGGWLYTPESNGDEGSVTITQVQALRACRNAGIAVPHQTIKRAVSYIELSQQPDGGIAYRVGNRGSQPAITAAGAAVLYNAGEYDSKAASRCLEYCRRNIDVGSAQAGFGHWFYTHLYLSQAYWQSGGKDWERYYPQVRDRLMGSQEADGSWQGDGVGKVYGTAIAVTVLSLPYEHVPLYMR